jgi:hypothetical protein
MRVLSGELRELWAGAAAGVKAVPMATPCGPR